MQPFIAALAAIALLGGIAIIVMGMQPSSEPPTARPPRRFERTKNKFIAVTGGQTSAARRIRRLLGIGVVVGMLGWLLTGWVLLVVIVPLAIVGIPTLLAAPDSKANLAKLEAMEEWTRSLAGVLTVGVGIEQALTATLRSTPDAIHPEVTTLVARLRARWQTVPALRAFADDLNDATGDLIASSLILGATRRGAGLAAVLEGLATTVAQDVQIRRKIEADRTKPRTTARIVTIITLAVLGLMSLNPTYIAPYGTPTGQVLLGVLLTFYILCLMWMRRVSSASPLPRIMGRKLRAKQDQLANARSS